MAAPRHGKRAVCSVRGAAVKGVVLCRCRDVVKRGGVRKVRRLRAGCSPRKCECASGQAALARAVCLRVSVAQHLIIPDMLRAEACRDAMRTDHREPWPGVVRWWAGVWHRHQRAVGRQGGMGNGRGPMAGGSGGSMSHGLRWVAGRQVNRW